MNSSGRNFTIFIFCLICLANMDSLRTLSAAENTVHVGPDVYTVPGNTYVTNSFESVEMEKLRIAKEVGKLAKDDADFDESVIKLQKKLAEASILALLPPSVPSELRTFLNQSSNDILKAKQYYGLLTGVLNNLTPQSPYNLGISGLGTVNLKQATDLLRQAAAYEEDEGLAQTILNQWGAKEVGARDDSNRIVQLNSDIWGLEREIRRLEWNYKLTFKTNMLSGEAMGSESDRTRIQEQINEVKKQISDLQAEKNTFKAVVTLPFRKLEFQQFILQLALQERYIHSLIACGVYRNVFTGGDMSFKQEAKPGGSTQGQKPAAPAQELSAISTIPSLESFLLNRIRDAKKDREALENMLKAGQLATAESLAEKMITTAKYQPELHTLPIDQRQKIRDYYQQIRQVSEAVNSKNYPLIRKLSGAMTKNVSDIGPEDLVAFADENRKKALFWVKQSEAALRAGDFRASQILLETAQRRDPHDPEVESAVAGMQDNTTSGLKLKDELDDLIRRQDYATAFRRANDFMALASIQGNESLKQALTDLLDKEKMVMTSLEKCSSLEKVHAYPDAWMVLDTAPEALCKDTRILERKSELTGLCGDFVAAYTKGRKFEVTNQKPLALAWYLEALSVAPENADMKQIVSNLAENIINKPQPPSDATIK